MLANPRRTRKVLQSLQKERGAACRRGAVRPARYHCLSNVLQELSSDPQAAKAMEQLNKTLNK